jgi:hypothetical protein
MIKKEATSTKEVMTKAELEQALLNNFVNLQKVLTNLSVKFEDLSNNISKILQLFEISAKSFAEKYSSGGGTDSDREFLKKLDALLDQNKTIAKGIMLMEERVRQRNQLPSAPVEENRFNPTEGNRFEGMVRSKPFVRY